MGDVGFSRGDFTWNGDPTFTVAIFPCKTPCSRKVYEANAPSVILEVIGGTALDQSDAYYLVPLFDRGSLRYAILFGTNNP